MKRNLLKQSVIAILVGGSALATAANNMPELKTMVEDLNEDLTHLIDDYDAHETEVNAKLDQHSATLGRHTNRLNNLKDLVEDAQDDVYEALNRVELAEDEITTLTNRVDGAAAALGLLSQSVGLNKTNIEKKADKTEVDANKAAIATNKAEIATNKTAIEANKANIATNKTAIDANTANIATNKADIATHTQRLDNLDNRVNNLNKDLKRGLASQAALNGLFQPYNVGKLNLTAAVGGYKSQTAVAVGTGYRHNENVATKAGVAFTHGGSATYNVGVNFEW